MNDKNFSPFCSIFHVIEWIECISHTKKMSKLRQQYHRRIEGRVAPFYGAFVQVAHQENNPKSEEPMYRVLRLIHHADTYEKALSFIKKRMPNHGNILFVKYGEPLLIAQSVEKQIDPSYSEKRVVDIENEWMTEHTNKQNRIRKHMELRRSENHAKAIAMREEFTKKYNNYGWVKYMKGKVGYTELDLLEPGARCEAPPNEDDVAEFEEEAVDLHTLPDRILTVEQKHIAVSVLMSNDDTMEAVLYIHDVYSDLNIVDEDSRKSFEKKMHSLSLLCSPMNIDVVDVGVWNMPVRSLWTNEPLDQSYGDSELNDLQRQRVKDATKQDMEKAMLLERERQSELAFYELATVSELDIELVKQICSTKEGGEEFTHAVRLANKGSREDAIELCIEKYGTPEGGAPGPPLTAPPPQTDPCRSPPHH
jgi:hypothetical protein